MNQANEIISLLEAKNEKGFVVGTKGKTGTHAMGGTYRKSSVIPRSGGGVLVIVAGELYSEDGDELRFETEKEAHKFLDSLKRKTKAQKNNIPF